MPILLRVPRLSDLERAALTYPEVGATTGTLPSGYRHVVRSARVGAGPEVFERCSSALMRWEVHRRAGLGVYASDPQARPGTVVASVLGWRGIGVVAPCRVVYVVSEENRRGFGYGTLAGHPEVGEEAFVVSHRHDDAVVLEVCAFSRPAPGLSRIGDPVGQRVQWWVTSRYFAAARKLAAG